MEIEYALLADAAQQSSDGKLYVMGGGIGTIGAKTFPTIHPTMSLVLKLQLHPSECDREHRLEVQLWDADGQSIGTGVNGAFNVPRSPEGRLAYAQMILNILQARFEKPGDYAFHIIVDGQHVKTLPLELQQGNSGGSAPEVSPEPA